LQNRRETADVEGTTIGDAYTYADPIERRIGRGSAIAVALTALVLLLLTYADCSGSASRAVLTITDIDDLAIEKADLPGIQVQSFARTFKTHLEWGYVSVYLAADETATGAETYPAAITQSIHYNSDLADARRHLERERYLNT
jgi:hypothetical protein